MKNGHLTLPEPKPQNDVLGKADGLEHNRHCNEAMPDCVTAHQTTTSLIPSTCPESHSPAQNTEPRAVLSLASP